MASSSSDTPFSNDDIATPAEDATSPTTTAAATRDEAEEMELSSVAKGSTDAGSLSESTVLLRNVKSVDAKRGVLRPRGLSLDVADTNIGTPPPAGTQTALSRPPGVPDIAADSEDTAGAMPAPPADAAFSLPIGTDGLSALPRGHASGEGAEFRDLVFYVVDGFPSHVVHKSLTRWFLTADIYSNAMFFIVLLSSVSFITETLPDYWDRDLLAFSVIETFCIAIFSLDLIIRLIFVRSKLSFVRSVQTWIDFISIVPFYLNFFVDASGAAGLVMFRTFRLIRVFRVLKLSKRSIGLQAVIESIQQSSEAISLLAFLLVIAMVVFSSAMYFAEQTESYYDPQIGLWMRANGLPSPYQSIFHTMWWCVVTMTTVGYGDDVPLSPLGKVVAAITMLCGVFVLAFPTVILSTNFQEVHQAKLDAQKQLRTMRQGVVLVGGDDHHDGDDKTKKGGGKVGPSAAGGADAEDAGGGGAATSSGGDEQGQMSLAHLEELTNAVRSAHEGAKVQLAKGMLANVAAALEDQADKFTHFCYEVAPYRQQLLKAVQMAATSMLLGASPKGTRGDRRLSRQPGGVESQGSVVVFNAGPSPPPPRRGSTSPESTLTPLDPGTDGTVGSHPHQVHRHHHHLHAASGGPNKEKKIEELKTHTTTGSVTIVDNEFAVFEPAVYLRITDAGTLLTRMEPPFPGTPMELITVFLSVDGQSDALLQSVHAACALHRPQETFQLVSRPIKSLHVDLHCTHPLLKDICLVTTAFERPSGWVPLVITSPSRDVSQIMLANPAQLQFRCKVFYDQPCWIEEPLLRYGGVVLCGDAFDDGLDHRNFIATTEANLASDGADGGGCRSPRAMTGGRNFDGGSPRGGLHRGGGSVSTEDEDKRSIVSPSSFRKAQRAAVAAATTAAPPPKSQVDVDEPDAFHPPVSSVVSPRNKSAGSPRGSGMPKAPQTTATRLPDEPQVDDNRAVGAVPTTPDDVLTSGTVPDKHGTSGALVRRGSTVIRSSTVAKVWSDSQLSSHKTDSNSRKSNASPLSRRSAAGGAVTGGAGTGGRTTASLGRSIVSGNASLASPSGPSRRRSTGWETNIDDDDEDGSARALRPGLGEDPTSLRDSTRRRLNATDGSSSEEDVPEERAVRLNATDVE